MKEERNSILTNALTKLAECNGREEYLDQVLTPQDARVVMYEARDRLKKTNEKMLNQKQYAALLVLSRKAA